MNQANDPPIILEESFNEDDGPHVIQNVDQTQLQHFVTEIKTAEQQVGENIIRALEHDDTVAVLTTVVMSPDGRQQVVTAALDPQLMQQVQQVLHRAQQEREREAPCFGFHCFVKPKGGRPDPGGDSTSAPDPSD